MSPCRRPQGTPWDPGKSSGAPVVLAMTRKGGTYYYYGFSGD